MTDDQADVFTDPTEPTDEELDRLISLRRSVLSALAPDPREVSGRIGLIGRLAGRAPTMQQLYITHVVFEGLMAIAEGREIKIISPAEFFETRAVSLRGKGRDELVKAAAGYPPKKKSAWFGGEKEQ